MARYHSRREQQRGNRFINVVIGGLAALAIGGAVVGMQPGSTVSVLSASLPGSGCDIKGNVSINSGKRIYHMPGQEDYSTTVIRAEYGERWFCSETEALEAGWQRASR